VWEAVHAGFPERDAVGSGAIIPCNSLVPLAIESGINFSSGCVFRFIVLGPSCVLNSHVWILVTWGTNAMTETTPDQNFEELFAYDVSDEVLEVAACEGKANTFTQWVCTSMYFCPGP